MKINWIQRIEKMQMRLFFFVPLKMHSWSSVCKLAAFPLCVTGLKRIHKSISLGKYFIPRRHHITLHPIQGVKEYSEAEKGNSETGCQRWKAGIWFHLQPLWRIVPHGSGKFCRQNGSCYAAKQITTGLRLILEIKLRRKSNGGKNVNREQRKTVEEK